MRSRDFQVFLGICIAGLSAAVVWLSVRDRTPPPPDSRVAALTHRIGLLGQQLATVQASASELARRTAAQLQAQQRELVALRARRPQLATQCLNELQQEIDDIRGFIAYGGGIRKRVSSRCTQVLKPRFGG